MEITGNTRLCALIGDPVEHSLSPLMHNAAFKFLGLEIVYMAFKVESNHLEKALEGIKSLKVIGINVTIPHKTAILKFLDEIDARAAEIGAVNTVANIKGKLVGYNTDGLGALKTLVEEGADPSGKKVVLLGAGGAARSIAYYIAPLTKSLVILNRTESRAKELSENLNKRFDTSVRGRKLKIQNLSEELEVADILINSTSIGMYPYSDRTIVSRSLIRPDMTVFDIVYNPLETLLLREAKVAGAKRINGAKMLVYQGALAFEIWLDRKAPVDIMLRTVTDRTRRGDP